MRRLLIILVLLPVTAFAQGGPVQQSGKVTPGHIPVWATNGVVQDGGAATNGVATNIGLVGTGLPFCINDYPVTSPGGYHQVCLGANVSSSGGLLSYQSYGGASSQPLKTNINGLSGFLASLVGPITNGDCLQASGTEGAVQDSGSPCDGGGGSSDDYGAAFPPSGTPIGGTDGTLFQPFVVDPTTHYLDVDIKAGGTVAQGSVTVGQGGSPIMGASATAPPSQSNGQTNFVSLDLNGGLRLNPACNGVINISQTASTDVHTFSGYGYICAVALVSATQQSVGIDEGTGTTCETGGTALIGVGSTSGATAEMALAQYGTFAVGTGIPFLKLHAAGDHLCVLQSSTGEVAGTITYADESN